MNGRFVINRTRAKVMGVCAGLADWLNVDVLVVRLGVVFATLMTGPETSGAICTTSARTRPSRVHGVCA